MRFTTDLILEGIQTVDRRLVLPGATTWEPDGSWPIVYQYDHHAVPEKIGTIVSLSREGWAIVARCEREHFCPGIVIDAMTSGRSFRLEADLQVVRADADTIERGLPVFTTFAAIVLGATVQVPSVPAWPVDKMRYSIGSW